MALFNKPYITCYYYSEFVLCLCTITDDFPNVVGGGQVTCEGHVENLKDDM